MTTAATARRRRRRSTAHRLAAIVAAAAPGGPGRWTASDDFNRPDGPLGPDWTILTAGWTIIANQASSITPDATAHHNTVPATANYWAQATLAPPLAGNNTPGIALRITDANNLYCLTAFKTVNTLFLRKRVAAVETTIQTYPNAVWPITVRLAVATNQLTVTIAGVPQPPETDVDLTAPGFPGLFMDAAVIVPGTVDDWSAGS